jgi:hypothetical protein
MGPYQVVTLRQTTNGFIGSVVDNYLSPEDAKLVYDKWQQSWTTPTSIRGGSIVTLEMITEIPESEFLAILGKRTGKRIYDIAVEKASR